MKTSAQQILVLDWHRIFLLDPVESLLSGKAFRPGECCDCLDAKWLLAFTRGELIEWEFFRYLYGKNQGREDLPHPRKLKKRVLSGIHWNARNLERLEELREEGFLVALAASVPSWYRSFTAPVESRWDYLFLSCEMGFLMDESAFFGMIRESLQTTSPQVFLFSSVFDAHNRAAASSGFSLRKPEELGFLLLDP